MAQPYTGPEHGHGIGALGGVTKGGLRSAMEFAEMIVDTVREGLLVLDFDLRVQAANESFYRMFGLAREAAEGRLVYEIADGQWDDPPLRELLERILPQRSAFDDFEIEQKDADGAPRVFLLNARRLDHHELVLLAIEDATERVRAREALERRVLERTQEVRRLAARLTEAEQAERERIAHILHDDLQQHLFGLSLLLPLLRRPAAPDGGTEALTEQAAAILDEAVRIARTLAAELSPAILHAERLRDLLDWIAQVKHEKYGLQVSVELREDSAVEDHATRVLLYQSLCEVLLNVAKHSGQNEARLVAWVENGAPVVRVEDDGAGFDMGVATRGRGGFGLFSVRDRVELVGGRLEIDSAPGAGTRITIRLPRSGS